MELQQIYNLIASLLPSLTAIATTVATLVTVYKKVKGSLSDSTKKIDELSKKTSQLLQENAELKQIIRRKIDKIETVEELTKKVK